MPRADRIAGTDHGAGPIPLTRLRIKLCVPVVLSVGAALAGLPTWSLAGLLMSVVVITAAVATQGWPLVRLLLGAPRSARPPTGFAGGPLLADAGSGHRLPGSRSATTSDLEAYRDEGSDLAG